VAIKKADLIVRSAVTVEALAKIIDKLKVELEEAKQTRRADPDLVDGLANRISELEKKLTIETEKMITLPGGKKIKAPVSVETPKAKAEPEPKPKEVETEKIGGSLYD